MTNAIAIAQGGSNNVTMRNRIINGAMVIDQRNAGASVTPTNGTYTLDRWAGGLTQASKYTVQQTPSTTESGYATRVAAGFSNYLAATVGASANVTVGTNDYFYLQQPIEGYNTADLAWGTANAKSITLSFWVYSSVTGTYGGSLKSTGSGRSYPFTYTISSANTWSQISINIAGDTSGTWNTTNGIGINLTFGLGVGSNYTGTAGTWASANYLSATGAGNWISTNSATFYITGVQLEAGTTASPFEYRQYGTELVLCQRYYQKSGYGMCGRAESATLGNLTGSYIVEMRAAPSGTLLNGTSGIATFGVSTYNISSLTAGANGTHDYRQAVNTTGMTTGAIINGYSESVIGWSAEL